MKASEPTLAYGTLPVSTNMMKSLLALNDSAKLRVIKLLTDSMLKGVQKKRAEMSSGLKRLDGCLMQADKLDVTTDERLKYIMEKNK